MRVSSSIYNIKKVTWKFFIHFNSY
jgi:hypothetical protein